MKPYDPTSRLSTTAIFASANSLFTFYPKPFQSRFTRFFRKTIMTSPNSRLSVLFAMAFITAFGFHSASLAQAPAVATGDARTVTEPSFPATCQTLFASFHDVNEDVPLSVETGNTNLDQARLQAALNACTGTNQAVELSMDASGNNSFLTGPISIPAGVILLIDPGVTLYFSRNAQDYDTTQGTHTCGTVSSSSNTCKLPEFNHHQECKWRRDHGLRQDEWPWRRCGSE